MKQKPEGRERVRQVDLRGRVFLMEKTARLRPWGRSTSGRVKWEEWGRRGRGGEIRGTTVLLWDSGLSSESELLHWPPCLQLPLSRPSPAGKPSRLSQR